MSYFLWGIVRNYSLNGMSKYQRLLIMFVSLEEKLVQVRKSDRNQTRQVQEIICNFIAIKLLLLIVS